MGFVNTFRQAFSLIEKKRVTVYPPNQPVNMHRYGKTAKLLHCANIAVMIPSVIRKTMKSGKRGVIR